MAVNFKIFHKETGGDIMKTKRLFSLVCSVVVSAFLAASCQAPALEEIQGPEGQGTEVVPEWTTIPYTLKVSTKGTRVSYDETSTDSYSFKSGDKIRVKGTGDRTDINGELTQGDNKWTGTISYLTVKGAPKSGETGLEVTLIHDGNTDASTYASALVGSGSVEGYETEEEMVKKLLQYAVEHYSLFTAAYTYDSSSTASVELTQQATFLDVKVEFDFDGSHIIDAGKALVDLTTTLRETTIETHFFEKPDTNGEDFFVHFIAVVPGGKKISDFTLTVGDRPITFANTNTVLNSNYKYTVNRTIEFRPKVGDPFWSDGTYGRLRHPDSQEKIVGIVVFVHDYKENMTEKEIAIADAITEKRYDDNGKQLYGHGLVMALTNAAVDVPWSAAGGKILCTGGTITEPEHTLVSNNLSGYTNTGLIRSALTGADVYSGSAVFLVDNYTYNNTTVSTTSTTGWFLPSVGQWMYTISEDGFGKADPASQWINGNGISWLVNNYHEDDAHDNDDPSGNLGDLVLVKLCNDPQQNVLVKSLNDRLKQFQNEFEVTYDSFGDPPTSNNVSDNYWTSSEKDANNAIRMNLGSVRRRGNKYYSTIKVKGEDKEKVTVYTENNVDYKMKVRPFLAF